MDRNLTYAETLSRLIQCETISSKGQTDLEKFYHFHDLLSETFPHLWSVITREVFDGSLLLRWPGTHPEKDPLVLMSHHDVVEATGTWSHEAFSGDIADGRVWGRGTLDTKGNLWAILQAAEELAATGWIPDRDVYFVSACNEETSGHGGDTISRELEKRSIHPFMVLDEGGMILTDPVAGAHGTFAVAGVGEKGIVDLKFTAHSRGGHASTPGKNTPLVRLGKFMAAAEKTDAFAAEMPSVVQEMFTRMAPTMSGYMKFLCSHLKIFKGLMTKVMPSVSPVAGAMVKTTLAFTMAHGSEGSNVLPQEAYVIGNMRFSHHQGREASIEAIRKLAARYDIETEVLTAGIESPLSDYRSEAFRLVERAVDAAYPGVKTIPYIMNAASDSRFFGRVCENCIRFAPFRISNEQLDSVHGIDENVDVSTLAQAVDFFKYILQEV